MGRYINPETAGKERTQLTRAVVLALRQLMLQTEANELTRDLAAFIALTLDSIDHTIDASVVAWEKRGYWVKADQFRLEWSWAGMLGAKMRQAVLNEDWMSVAQLSAQVAQKLTTVKLPQRHGLGEPWGGAYARLTAK